MSQRTPRHLEAVLSPGQRSVPELRAATAPPGQAEASSAADQAALAAAEAIAAEAAAVIAAESAASAAATVNAAVALAAEALIHARQTAERAADAGTEGLATTATSDPLAHPVGRTVTEAIAAERAALDVARAATLAAAEVTATASDAAAAAADAAREAVALAATVAAGVVAKAADRAAETLSAAAATAAETVTAAGTRATTAAEETLATASDAAVETLITAAVRAEARLAAAAGRAEQTLVTARHAADADLAAEAAESAVDNGPETAPADYGTGTESGQAMTTEWAVQLADPVMASFSWDPSSALSFSSPAERGLWRDISLARRMEAALRAEEGHFAAAFQSAPAAMLVVSLRKGHLADFLHANPAMARLTGYSTVVLLGLGFEDLTHPEDTSLDEILTDPGRSRADTEPVELLQRWVHADGHEMWVRIRMAPARPAAEAADRWVCQVEDVTVWARADATRRHVTRSRRAAAGMSSIWAGPAQARLLPPSSIPSAPARSANPEAEVSSDHSVLFYHDERELVRRVADYVGNALSGGGHALLIVTPERAGAVRAGLSPRRLARADQEGRLVIRDLAQTLALFIRDGLPDPELFFQTVGALVRGQQDGANLYSDMGAVLGQDRNRVAAQQLEALWTQLRRDTGATMVCGYPLADREVRTGSRLAEICHQHTQVYLT